MKKKKAAPQQPVKKAIPKKPLAPLPSLIKLYPFKPKVCYGIIGALTFVLYFNTLFNQYALDDSIVIKENIFTQRGFAGIGKIMSSDVFLGFFKTEKNLVAGGRYRPLSLVTFAIEHQLWGDIPAVSHFINLLLYALTGIAIFIFLTRLFSKNDKLKSLAYLPLLTALLFIAHPLHTEAVANIKGRDEIMTFLFAVISANYFLKYYDEQKVLSLLIAGVCFFLALLSKENAITWVAIIPLLFYFFRKSEWRKIISPVVITMIVSGIYLALRQTFTKTSLQQEVTEILNNPFYGASQAQKFATIIYTFGKYLLLLIFPHPLTHDYYYNQITWKNFSDIWVIITIVIYVALGTIAIIQFRKKTLLSFCIIYFAITFSVVSNIFFPVGTTMSERFLYMSSFAFSIYTAYLLLKLADIFIPKGETNAKPDLLKNKLALAIIAVILIGYGGKTIARNPAWKDNYSLSSTDIHTSSNSAKLNNFFGGVSLEFLDRKDISAIEKKRHAEEAKEALKKAIEIYPDYNNAWLLLGNAYLKSDSNFAEAVECYVQALNINPTYPDAITNMKVALVRIKGESARIALLKKMSEKYPANYAVLYQYGNECMRAHLVDSAIHIQMRVIKMKPNHSEALNDIGLMYGQDKNIIDSSIYYLQRAINANPNNDDAEDNLAVAYGIKGRFQDAIDLLQQAIQRNPRHGKFYFSMGITYRAMGDMQLAQTYFDKAKEVDPEMMSHMNY